MPGWDLTFSAPKSVSLLYALAPAAVQQILVAAHERAVEKGFRYLQREAGFVRRGHNGTRLEPGAGLIGAAFRHRSSRVGDPQLHTHVLLPNLVATVDGQWRTVHSRAFYRHARAAGALYRAALRDSLTRQLGVTWRPRPHGLYEIAGIPQPVLRAFTRRRIEIEQVLEERGLFSAKAADVATLATRTAKSSAIDELGRHERWRQRADELGFDQDALRAVLGPHGASCSTRSAPRYARVSGPWTLPDTLPNPLPGPPFPLGKHAGNASMSCRGVGFASSCSAPTG